MSVCSCSFLHNFYRFWQCYFPIMYFFLQKWSKLLLYSHCKWKSSFVKLYLEFHALLLACGQMGGERKIYRFGKTLTYWTSSSSPESQEIYDQPFLFFLLQATIPTVWRAVRPGRTKRRSRSSVPAALAAMTNAIGSRVRFAGTVAQWAPGDRVQLWARTFPGIPAKGWADVGPSRVEICVTVLNCSPRIWAGCLIPAELAASAHVIAISFADRYRIIWMKRNSAGVMGHPSRFIVATTIMGKFMEPVLIWSWINLARMALLVIRVIPANDHPKRSCRRFYQIIIFLWSVRSLPKVCGLGFLLFVLSHEGRFISPW